VELAVQAPDFAVNLSASPYSVAKFGYRLDVCSKAAAALRCPLIFCNQVGGNYSLIFDGYSLVLNEHGKLCDWAKGFEAEDKIIDLSNSTPRNFESFPQEELYAALVLGLKDYFTKSGFTKACLGLSGVIDSALVACIAAEALGKENVLGISMPSRYSSPGSITDAHQLAKNLGIGYREISIEDPFKSYLELLKPAFEGKAVDVTEENLQSRIRGMILMAMSNKFGYITLSTGNKSELAVGYSTLYGDMCGGLGVISDVTKNQVYALSNWINRDKEIIPWNTIRKAPSAELREGQMDSDSLPPYEVLDNVLISYVEDHESPENIAKLFGYPLEQVKDLIQRIHKNEYKRRQSPPGLRISEKAFTTGRHFPIVQRFI
jgi:NAD+ synthase (glutamine-hydrolysing)